MSRLALLTLLALSLTAGCKKGGTTEPAAGSAAATPTKTTAPPAKAPSGEFKITLKADTGLADCDKYITAMICYWKANWDKQKAPVERRKREHDLFAKAVETQYKSGNAEWKAKANEQCKKTLAGLAKTSGFETCVPK